MVRTDGHMPSYGLDNRSRMRSTGCSRSLRRSDNLHGGGVPGVDTVSRFDRFWILTLRRLYFFPGSLPLGHVGRCMTDVCPASMLLCHGDGFLCTELVATLFRSGLLIILRMLSTLR